MRTGFPFWFDKRRSFIDGIDHCRGFIFSSDELCVVLHLESSIQSKEPLLPPQNRRDTAAFKIPEENWEMHPSNFEKRCAHLSSSVRQPWHQSSHFSTAQYSAFESVESIYSHHCKKKITSTNAKNPSPSKKKPRKSLRILKIRNGPLADQPESQYCNLKSMLW